MTDQKFGGNWTVEKLDILSDYLDFYLTALKNQKFKKIYIDAFAGTGTIQVGDGTETIDGSAKLALNTKSDFDEYIFIEKNKKFYNELNTLIDTEYPQYKDKVKTYNMDCNEALKKICTDIDWRFNRAILFLDPYAAELEWETLKIIAETKAIDVWYLFPFSAANRMLTKNKHIDDTWKKKLNSLFGDDSWETELYKQNPQLSLFDNDNDNYVKDANTDKLKSYICDRLKTLFPAVSSNPRILYNQKNSPLFCFCFAVASDNPRAIGLALKVANHILKKEIK